MTTRRMTSTATETEAQTTHVDDMIDALITSDHIASHRIASHQPVDVALIVTSFRRHRRLPNWMDPIGWDGMGWDGCDGWYGMMCHGMGSDRHAGTENCNLPSFCNEGAPTANRQPPTTGLVAVVVQQNYGKLFMGCLNGPATDVLLLLLLLLLLVPQLLLLLLLPWLSRL